MSCQSYFDTVRRIDKKNYLNMWEPDMDKEELLDNWFKVNGELISEESIYVHRQHFHTVFNNLIVCDNTELQNHPITIHSS